MTMAGVISLVSVLIAMVGCFVGLAGWLSGRDKRLSKDAEWKGMVNTKLDLAIGIRNDHDELKKTVGKQGKELIALQHDFSNLKNQVQQLHKLD